eukprot:CAMPEP_0195249202 /NCGR_PEP_ID=MMETSP0706-20130129/1981_1 /TAXON_ID=33640 /ORGANISM="Asterionellopsis glacialis, Strain CCMP134" /LENGTH=201 /DNA_ID=CAMNT_0040300971 /DNA_START=24 /DNA_END=626 /DNA_ORIENTATION=-
MSPLQRLVLLFLLWRAVDSFVAAFPFLYRTKAMNPLHQNIPATNPSIAGTTEVPLSINFEKEPVTSMKDAAALNRIGTLHFNAGHYAEAREYFEEVLDITRTHQSSLPLVVETLNKLGNVDNAEGNYEGAIEKFEQVLKLKKSLYGPHAYNTDLASTLTKISIANEKLGRYDDARAKQQEAIEMMTKALEEPKIGTHHSIW